MPQASFNLNHIEKRTAVVVGSIYVARMLGLFMALPVLALADEHFVGVTPLLIGLALGIYGLPQALLQIPFGAWSDRVGRKPVIVVGLLIFVLGSLVAASAETITGVIIGRALQGAGAIAAAMMALVSDVTHEQRCSKAFAFIGIGIGLAFMLALIVGPPLEAGFGLRGIFLVSAALGVLAIVLALTALPSPVSTQAGHIKSRGRTGLTEIIAALRNRDLLRLSAGVFFLHMVMTANFLLLPPLLERQLGLERAAHGLFYAPVMVVSLLLILPLLRQAEKVCRVKEFLLVGIALLGMSQLALFFLPQAWLPVIAMMVVFFAAFNYLEASLPSLVGRFCGVGAKGAAMGVFANGQFLGAFVGGALAGVVASLWGSTAVYLLNGGAVAVWLLFAAGMGRPRSFTRKSNDGGE